MRGAILLPRMAVFNPPGMRAVVQLTLILPALLLFGCGKKAVTEEVPATTEAAPSNEQKATVAGGQLSAVQEAVKKGEVDKAAAQLLQMKEAAANFSPKEAAQYRDVMSDAYSKALEAAQRGDPKGVAALQMIRATTQR
jgi:hypothetical protein